jgi:OOP family OmpA-OmpF porin
MHSFRLASCAWLAVVVSSSAAAQSPPRQVPGFELEHLTFNPAQQAGLLLGTGDLLPEKQLRASVVLHYQHNPLILTEEGGQVGSIIRSRITAHIAAAYGITRWLEVGLQVPVVVWQNGDRLAQVTSPAGAGLGTPWIQGRFALLSQERDQHLDLGIQLGLGLPIGSTSALARDGSVGFSPRVGAGHSFGFLRAGLEIGALIRQGAVLSPDTATVLDEVGSVFQFGANLTTTRKGLRGELNLLGWVPFTRAPGSMELLAGARYPIGPVELFAIAGPGFGHSPGTPAFRAMLGVGLNYPERNCDETQKYDPKSCPELDLDRDGILNGKDECVTEPGLAELAGCPDRDSDGDGVFDTVDKCPRVKGLAAFAGCPDSDDDGLPDAEDKCPTQAGPKKNQGCPLPVDSDGDGLLDPDDRCQTVPGPKENQGCPWPDVDADGVLDKDDGCPNVPGPSENKGCPWPDTDKDGVVDPFDSCPTEPGPAERKGCPIKDADGDTVPDELDNCPKEAGPVDNQGCPKEKVQLVVITREKLMIKEKVFFDTGKATIKPQSFPLLTQVAEILNDHTEIPKISIEGHTDNVGKPDANRKLSEKRAQSVREFLVKKGVASKRLDAKGFGPDRPADVNTTPAGRENNRRVEFVVVPEVSR